MTTQWRENYDAALQSYEEYLKGMLQLVSAINDRRLYRLEDKPISRVTRSTSRVVIHYGDGTFAVLTANLVDDMARDDKAVLALTGPNPTVEEMVEHDLLTRAQLDELQRRDRSLKEARTPCMKRRIGKGTH